MQQKCKSFRRNISSDLWHANKRRMLTSCHVTHNVHIQTTRKRCRQAGRTCSSSSICTNSSHVVRALPRGRLLARCLLHPFFSCLLIPGGPLCALCSFVSLPRLSLRRVSSLYGTIPPHLLSPPILLVETLVQADLPAAKSWCSYSDFCFYQDAKD